MDKEGLSESDSIVSESEQSESGRISKLIEEDNEERAYTSSVQKSVVETMQEKTDSLSENILQTPSLTTNELREFRGILAKKVPEDADREQYITTIQALEIEKTHWSELSKQITNSDAQKELYESISQVAEHKADQIRIKINQLPENEEAKSILEEEIQTNDVGRFVRFKRWARNNLGNLSLAAITVAGIIISIVLATWSTVKQGARAAGKMGKTLYNVGKKIGPFVGAVFGLLGKLLTLGAVGLAWLSQNIWVLFLALIFFAYYYFKNRKN